MPDAPIGPEDRLYLVDGSGFLFRAFHALPPLTRASDGLPIGAVSGFCNMLFRFMREVIEPGGPSHLAVVFDHSGKTFRNALYPDYKANRPPLDPNLKPQLPLVRDAARAFGFACVERENFEADDLIATYARQAARAGAAVVIYSSDKDLMQLLDDSRICMRDTMKDAEIGAQQVREKFGVGPEQMVDLQALAGDSSDNVPGAPGIGPKTAAALLAEYGDLDALLAAAHTIRQPKRREVLTQNVDQIRLSRQLVTLDDQAPVPVPLDALRVHRPSAGRLLAFLREMEFRTITGRVEAALKRPAATGTGGAGASPVPAPPAEIAEAQYTPIGAAEVLAEWVERAQAQGVVAVDVETDSLDAMQSSLVGVSLALAPGEAAYVPLGHHKPAAVGGLFEEPAELLEGQIPREQALALLTPLMEDQAVLKIGHNIKFDALVLRRAGIAIGPVDDTMLMSYALAAGRHRHGLDALAELHFGHTMQPIRALIGKGAKQKSFADVALDQATPYAAEDADLTLRLHGVLRRMLITDSLCTVYETLERPLLPVLVEMERAGVCINPDELRAISAEFGERAAALETEIHALAGEPFNLASPRQLGTILFEKLGLPGGKRTSTGSGYQTGVDVLEEIDADGHPIARPILDWRHLTKLKSTYADALVQHMHPKTGRVHTSFSLAATTTGRLASTDPNLQNIPVRTAEGTRIRRAFVAAPGHRLLSLDYSQIELRILAHVADISALKDAFRAGLDIHAMTASEVFGVPVDAVDPLLRRRAKAINFGVIYGISEFGLANQLRIPRPEAKAFIDAYFERFPGIREYMQETVRTARDRGYVETLFGRRVHTPDINAKGPRRGFQERAAINAPIQGSAADIIRRAMIRIPAVLQEAGEGARMLLQVHDELLFEVPERCVEGVRDRVRAIMEGAAEPVVQLAVPLTVDAGAGDNWAEAH